jgi:broad specificity phosphatase PhoE
VSPTPGGFDALSGAEGEGARPPGPPAGVRTVPADTAASGTVVLVRHGEAVCNVTGVCGGPKGCDGLTPLGRRQVEALRDRLAGSGELAGATALYASVLPRAVETAELVRPALRAEGDAAPAIVTECGLCELHPGEADGLTWEEFTRAFGELDWDDDPDRPIAPGGESWTGFVHRVEAALDAIAARHPGELVVVACHAGVVEASLLAKVPVAGGRTGARLKLRTSHASLTTWEVDAGRWRLLAYNDAAHLTGLPQTASRWWAPRPVPAVREA